MNMEGADCGKGVTGNLLSGVSQDVEEGKNAHLQNFLESSNNINHNIFDGNTTFLYYILIYY